jgi:hypothetical protein
MTVNEVYPGAEDVAEVIELLSRMLNAAKKKK